MIAFGTKSSMFFLTISQYDLNNFFVTVISTASCSELVSEGLKTVGGFNEKKNINQKLNKYLKYKHQQVHVQDPKCTSLRWIIEKEGSIV